MLESANRWTRSDLQHYVSLHFRVAFKRQEFAREIDAPDMVIERASNLFARAMIDDDQRFMDGVYAIFRYQTWRGGECLQAYLDAHTQARSSREAKFFRELEDTANLQFWFQPKEMDV